MGQDLYLPSVSPTLASMLGSVHYLREGGGAGKIRGGASNFCVARKGGVCNFF